MSKSLQISDLVPRKLPKIEISGTTKLDGMITFGRVTGNSSKIESLLKAAINEASLFIAKDLKIALDAAMRSNVWSGPQGASDIYDSGELLNSGAVTVDSSGIRVYYTAPYAALIHYGGYINPYGNLNARVYLPPRPWVESVLSGGGPIAAFDFKSYYQQALDRTFK